MFVRSLSRLSPRLHLNTPCFCPSLRASPHRDKHEVCRLACWDLCAAVNYCCVCVLSSRTADKELSSVSVTELKAGERNFSILN